VKSVGLNPISPPIEEKSSKLDRRNQHLCDDLDAGFAA
jgi:hypothetical protein